MKTTELSSHGSYEQDTSANANRSRFPGSAYISWCQPLARIQPEGWLSLAEDTLHVQAEEPARPVKTTVFPVEEHIDRQTHHYNHLIKLGGNSSLFHLVLPPYFLLRLETVQPFPTYALDYPSRLVVGWICQPVSRFDFVFEEVSEDGYQSKATFIKQSVERRQAGIIEREKELSNVQQLLHIQQGNLRYLELQAATHGMDVPLRLHNELEHTQKQIELLEQRMKLLE